MALEHISFHNLEICVLTHVPLLVLLGLISNKNIFKGKSLYYGTFSGTFFLLFELRPTIFILHWLHKLCSQPCLQIKPSMKQFPPLTPPPQPHLSLLQGTEK